MDPALNEMGNEFKKLLLEANQFQENNWDTLHGADVFGSQINKTRDAIWKLSDAVKGAQAEMRNLRKSIDLAKSRI